MDYNPEELIIKFLSNDLTGEEERQLNEWRTTGKNNELFEELINKEHLRSELAKLNKIEKESEGVKVKARQLASVGAPVFMMGRKSMFYKCAIAASIIITVLSVGAYVYLRSNNKNNKIVFKNQTDSYKNDVQPGTIGAILTLNDGKKIILDSLTNGELSIQGNSKVVKQNGVLSYEPDGNSRSVVYNTITTLRGKQYPNIVLADGSRIWLDNESSVQYPSEFSGKERRIQITGQIYIEVAHDTTKPFIVQSGDVNIQVLGTKFNINAFKDEPSMKITLLEGKVNILKGQISSTLMPGQQAHIIKGESNIQINKDVNIEEAIAWKNGWFQFHDVNIPTMMLQIRRWYDVAIEYDGKIPEIRLSAAVPRDITLVTLLKAMELNNVHCKVQGKRLLISQ